MASPAALANVTVLSPRAANSEVAKFIPAATYAELPFWEDLAPGQKETIMGEANQLFANRILHGLTDLAMGYHLSRIHAQLEPYENAFSQFTRKFRFSRATCYRRINQYKEVSEMLAEPIVRAALARGTELTSGHAAAIEKCPPPRALGNAVIDGKMANAYLDKVETVRKELRATQIKRGRRSVKHVAAFEVRRSYDFLLMQNYRLAKNALSKLPTKQRIKFITSLTGMLLTEHGIGNAQLFKPEAIPAEFRQGRGRPRLVQGEE
jgi:hypothetical protein